MQVYIYIIMKSVALVTRVLLGLIFLLIPFNNFFRIVPLPPYHPFMEIMVSSGFIYIVKVMEVMAGILLLTNRFILATLLMIGPIIINILFFHILIDQRNWPIAVVNLILYAILIANYRQYFTIFLKPKLD